MQGFSEISHPGLFLLVTCLVGEHIMLFFLQGRGLSGRHGMVNYFIFRLNCGQRRNFCDI